MFAKRFHLFTLMGFRVGLDPSWFLLAVLIVWSLATGYFPATVDGLEAATAWWLGLFGALGLFASIVFHEFAHAMVARRFDMPVTGITLFVFGGVAELKDEPPSPKAEFWVAIAGPLSSYLLAGLCHLAAGALPGGAGAPVPALFTYLALINFVLATFNLLPAFPLDGGRVLRAGVWWWTGSLDRATRLGAATGRVLGAVLLALGVLSIVSGAFLAGLWQALIGLFIIGAAGASQARLDMTLGLKDVTVDMVMAHPAISVPADTPVAELVERYFHGTFHKMFPVVEDGRAIGCVRLADVRRVPQSDWDRVRARDILDTDSQARAIGSRAPLLDALRVMREHDTSRLMVVDGGVVKGVLTMRDVMACLAMRQDLPRRPPPSRRSLVPDSRRRRPGFDGG